MAPLWCPSVALEGVAVLQGLGDVAQLPRDSGQGWMLGVAGLAQNLGSCEEKILLILGDARGSC